MLVRISEGECERILEECRRNYPFEACGALTGSTTEREFIIDRAIPLRNLRESSHSFEIDAEELWKVITEAEARGKEFLGFFHSHPAPPRPSEEDLKHMALWRGTVWVIVSMEDWTVSAYLAGEESSRIEMIRT